MNGISKGTIHIAFNAFDPAIEEAQAVMKSRDDFNSHLSFLCFDAVMNYYNPHWQILQNRL